MANDPGTLKYWHNGLPTRGLHNSDADPGALKFWSDGLPIQGLIQTDPISGNAVQSLGIQQSAAGAILVAGAATQSLGIQQSATGAILVAGAATQSLGIQQSAASTVESPTIVLQRRFPYDRRRNALRLRSLFYRRPARRLWPTRPR